MRKRRVIIYDDEEVIVFLFNKFFSSLDYEVLAFTEPAVCPVYEKNADACSQNSPCADIIITDFRMPRMNGLDLLRAQTRNGCKLTARNKAVTSGYLDEEIQAEIEGLGCRYFQKPVDFAQLKQWVAECENRIDRAQPLGTAPLSADLAGFRK